MSRANPRVGVVGAGTYGAVLASYLQESGRCEVVGFFDDGLVAGAEAHGLPVLGSLESAINSEEVDELVCSIGDNGIRREFCENAIRCNRRLRTYVHPSAVMDPSLVVGEGVIVMPGALTMPFARIGDFSMISMGSKIAHHTVLGTAVFVSTGANVGAGISIGDGVMVGIGATIMTGVRELGRGATIGAGSVVIRDVREGTTVVGVPAREI